MEAAAVIKIVVIVFVVVIFISLFQFYISVRPPRYKTDDSPEKRGLKYENVTLETKDKLKLKGWFIPNNKTKNAVIVGHGYPFSKENVLSFADFLHDDYNLLFYDFRYFGESEGKYTTAGYKEAEDIDAAIDYLKKKGMKNIGGIGISLSAAALLMNKNDELKAIVADSSYYSMDEMIKELYWIFPWISKMPFVWMTKLYSWLFLGINSGKVSPLENVKQLDKPIFYIHGASDRQILAKNSEILHENSKNSTLWIVEGARHVQSHYENPVEYERRVLEFFNENLK
ncbi:prolyl oligopeptidase family serine peptidase [Candidatus Woesearchaeota archaeon]|nr:prolyl oligopeptidase family serine peptidase [Candidatus Woesearchaeota archaeon]